MVESQRQISAPTVLPEDTQELNPPLGPRDDSYDALHPEKDEDTPETWMHGPSEGQEQGVCVCSVLPVWDDYLCCCGVQCQIIY